MTSAVQIFQRQHGHNNKNLLKERQIQNEKRHQMTTNIKRQTYLHRNQMNRFSTCMRENSMCILQLYSADLCKFSHKKNNKRSKHNIHENSFRVSVVVLVDFRTFYHKSTTACSYNTSCTHILLLWVENYADIYQTHLRPR